MLILLALALLLQTPAPHWERHVGERTWPARADGVCWIVDLDTPYTGPVSATVTCSKLAWLDTAEADHIIAAQGPCTPNNSGGWMALGPDFIQFRTRLRDHPEFRVLCFPPGPWLLVADGQVWTPGAEPGSWVLATPEQMPEWLRARR